MPEEQLLEPSPELPAQRGPRDEAISAAREDYAEHARDGDLEALLAPYHRTQGGGTLATGGGGTR